MNKSRILITGASGCVGQYTAAWLLENSDAEIILWLRDPKKLTAISTNNSRVKLLIGDLREPVKYAHELSTVTRLIHTATAWGDPQRALQVNVIAVKALLKLLNPEVIEQITYFSTASILDKNLEPLKEAHLYGTEYIQTKAKCLQELEKHPLAEKIIAVFPTLVFGGRIDGSCPFPTSYLTEGIHEASKWLWLARWIRAYSRFHFIHAADIAYICGHLATRPHITNFEQNKSPIKKLVLAQPAVSIDKAVDELCIWRGLRNTPRLPLKGWLIEILILILPIQINDWDRFSINQRHFIHDPITAPESFGGKSHARTLQEVFADSGLPKVKKLRKRAKLF